MNESNCGKLPLALMIFMGLSLQSVLAQTETASDLWPFGTELDFGYFETRGVERIDTLVLYNPDTLAFVIENIRPSCGCTAVDWPERPIEPGEYISIPVAFRCTKGGYVERHLDVYLSHLSSRERIYVLADCPER
jgi:hypothetical protein